MKYYRLDRAAVRSWRMSRGILLAILIFISAAVILSDQIFDFFPTKKFILYLVLGLICLAQLINCIVFPKIEYRQWKYIITDDKIEYYHGIFFVTRVVIPIIRIQNIEMSRGPINRKLGLANMKVFIASGFFEIPCLKDEVAEEIVEILKNNIYIRMKKKGLGENEIWT